MALECGDNVLRVSMNLSGGQTFMDCQYWTIMLIYTRLGLQDSTGSHSFNPGWESMFGMWHVILAKPMMDVLNNQEIVRPSPLSTPSKTSSHSLSLRRPYCSFITASPVRGCPSGLAQSISLPFKTDRLVFHVSCSACNCSWYFWIIMCYNIMLHCIGTDRIFLPYGNRPKRSRLAEYLEEK